MKVILLKDIPKVGKRNEIKDFSDGYAQNALIAKGLAVKATPAELAKLEAHAKNIEKKKQQENNAFDELVREIGKKAITLQLKTNEKGHLFSAVSKKDIVHAIQNTSGITLEENAIVFQNPIKEIGTHSLLIQKGDREGQCTILIKKA